MQRREYPELGGQIDLVVVGDRLRAYFWPWPGGGLPSPYARAAAELPRECWLDPWRWVEDVFVPRIRDGSAPGSP